MIKVEHDPYAALRIKDFRHYILARFMITIALQIQGVIVGWQVYGITKDPFSLGLIGLAEAIPSIVVSLYAGHLADVYNRKKIIAVMLGLLVVCSFCLFYFTLDASYFISQKGVFPIYLVIFTSGIARGFLGPANFAFMPQLFPDKKFYPNAITWNSSVWQAASVAGPAIGGLLYFWLGISFTYFTDFFLMLISLALITTIKPRPLPPSENKPGIKESLRTGIRFVMGNKVILHAISLDLFAVLFGGAVALLPVFASDVLHVGAKGLGFLRAAPAIGSVCMAVYLAYRPIKKKAGRKMLVSVAMFGVCMVLFAISKNFWWSLLLLALSGMFDCVSVIIRSSLLHLLTPENIKGRVSSVNNIFIGSSNEIGAFESGTAAKIMGLIPSVIFGGCMTLVVVGLTGWKAKELRELEL